MPRGLIESFDPRLLTPEDDPALWRQNRAEREERLAWNAEVDTPGSRPNRLRWMRDYQRGPDQPIDPPHRRLLRVKPFAKPEK